MKIGMIVLLLIALMLVTDGAVALCIADQDKGAQDIELAGGKRGNVTFPHRQHQEKLVDCNICHTVFEQKAGSIEALKVQGKLKPKHVMNKLCTKCHKEKKRAGEKTGPTTCTKCHIKQKS
jgi:hypothetical protein